MLVIKCAVFLCIVFYAYYKLKHPFWSRQPVFHFHDLHYWIYAVGQIEKNNKKTDHPRYYDPIMKLLCIKDVNSDTITRFVEFIQNHYAKEEGVHYSPTQENILSYLDPNSVICYKERKNEMIGCITSRSLNCFIQQSKERFSLGYVDYLCVHKQHRGKGLAPTLIYTIYDHLKKNREQVCLFKKEGVLAPYVPITTYYTYCFDLEDYVPENTLLTQKINHSILYDISALLQTKFKLVIVPPAIQFMNMKNIHVLGIVDNAEVDCLFFFRETFTVLDGKPAIELFASINNNIDKSQFVMAFFGCLSHFKEKMILIENTADNEEIIKHLNKKVAVLFKSKTGYYFYNYVMKPLFSKDVLMIT